jgi:vitamin B12 transporter
MGWKVGLTGALTLCAGAVQAQETVVLPPISVSATQIPTPQTELASSVTIISAEQIEREQRRTVPDLLQAQPGLNVVQTGGPGGQTAVFIRGTNANHVKVLLDGIDISDPTSPNGAVDFGHLLTSNLEKVEILRGPQSSLYGANAIGGVIYLTTKKGEGPPKMTATLEGGSFGSFNQSATLSGALERFNYSVNVSHVRASSTPVTPDYVLPPGQRRNNDFYDNLTYSGRFGADLTDALSVNVYSRATQSQLLFTNDSFNLATFLFEPNTQRTDQRADQAYGRAEAVWRAFDGLFTNTFGINHTFSTRTSTDPGIAPQTFNGWRDKYDWRGDIKFLPGQTLLLGLEHEDDRVRVPTAQASRGNDAGFAELQLQWLQRLFLVGNVRYDHNDVFGGHPTWRIAPAVIVPGTETKLKATYGIGFKSPSLLELYGDDPVNFFAANRNLQPEESVGWDIGFEQPLFNNRASFGATYYRSDITNLIQFVFGGPSLFTNANIGKAKIDGYEAFAAATLNQYWKVRVDYTQTNAQDEITGLELIRRPHHKVTGTAIWQPFDPWTFTASYVYVSEWIDFDRASSLRVTAPGYSVVNLAANYRVNANAELFGRIDNLFNNQYQDPYGWLRPGLGVFAGVRLSSL